MRVEIYPCSPRMRGWPRGRPRKGVREGGAPRACHRTVPRAGEARHRDHFNASVRRAGSSPVAARQSIKHDVSGMVLWMRVVAPALLRPSSCRRAHVPALFRARTVVGLPWKALRRRRSRASPQRRGRHSAPHPGAGQPRVRTERGRSRPPSAGSSGVCASPATRPASRGSTPRRRIRPPRGRAGSTMRSRTRRHASERRGAGRRNRIHSHRYMWCGRCRGRSPPMSRRVREPTARQLGDLHVSHRDRCRAARRAARGSGAGRG